MNRVFSSKAPRFVSRLPRTQHAAPNRTSALLRCGNVLTLTRFSTSNGSHFSRARFFSASRTMNSTEEIKNPTPALSSWSNVSDLDATAGPDPFNYTSGRWLRRDALEQNSRNVRFDFDALRRRVIALCPGATSVISYSKKEGGFNRVFIFHTDNAKRVVARLPYPIAGPQRLTTNSEVATIQFCRSWT